MYMHMAYCRDVLQRMQDRLRNRMKKRGGEGLSRDLVSVREEMKSKHGAKMDLRVSVHVHNVHVNVLHIQLFMKVYMYSTCR